MTSVAGFVADVSIESVGSRRYLTCADLGAFDPTTRTSNAILADDGVVAGTITTNQDNQVLPPGVSRAGYVSQPAATGEDWYELVHVIPRSHDVGFLLTAQSIAVEVYNGYRREDRSWDSFVNNAGAGVDLEGEPALPATVYRQGGIQMTLELSTSGPPRVDSTLEFGFDVVTIIVPVSLERIVLLSVRPEDEYREELEWLTDVDRAVDGGEVRASPREHPRQAFVVEFFLEDLGQGEFADERAAVENALFDWQARVFGFPLWHDEGVLTQPATAGDELVFVDSTDYADYRDGGLVCVVADRKTADVVDVVSHTSTSVTLGTALTNSYPAGTPIMPLRACYVTQGPLDGARGLLNYSRIRPRLEVIDNEVEIASLAAFSSFNSKLFLDGYLFASGESPETFEQELLTIDGDVGILLQLSSWDRHRRAGHWRAIVRGRQASWEHRQMLHALRGRQVSFYIPTWRRNLRPVLDLTSGSAALDVANVGYAKFVRNRQPKDIVRVSFLNGDPALLRTVLSSVEVDADRETLTLDDTWPSTYAPGDVDRIEFVEKSRLDSDRVMIVHGGSGAGRFARFEAPVKAVLN